jgi:hypothetical protein
MANDERLSVAKFEPVFRQVEPVREGVEVRRTVIGSLKGNKLVRIQRISGRSLEGETAHHRYQVELAAPHDRFDELKLIFSGLWTVAPREAATRRRDMKAELKVTGRFFNTYHEAQEEPLEKPEDIFGWFDAQKGHHKINNPPDIEPSIYTAKGMDYIRRKTKFRGISNG